METFAPEELLGDLNLPSLGQGVESKSLISQILSGAYGHDQHFIQQISTADQYATNRGQSALKALGNELFATKEANNELRKEMNRLKELVSRIKDDLHDLVCLPSLSELTMIRIFLKMYMSCYQSYIPPN